MKFEIKVENKGESQKLLLLRCLHSIFGITIPDARKIVDRIEELHAIGSTNSSIIIDSEEIAMSPIFKIEKSNPVFTSKGLGVEINMVEKDDAHLDLCKLLKNCIGMKFYMPHFGQVTLNSVAESGKVMRFEEHVILNNGYSSTGEEVCVFPSKEQRDWSLFVPPWIPKEGERVWVRDNEDNMWNGKYFKKMDGKKFGCGISQTNGDDAIGFWNECVPFEPIPW